MDAISSLKMMEESLLRSVAGLSSIRKQKLSGKQANFTHDLLVNILINIVHNLIYSTKFANFSGIFIVFF